MLHLWRAVDDEGTVLDIVIQRRRNKKAATLLLRKLLKNQGVKPTRLVTDRLDSYRAVLRLLDLKHLQDVGGRKNNRAECSHIPIRRRERKAQNFRSVRNTQKLLSAHGQIYNLFNHLRHLISTSKLRKFRHQAHTVRIFLDITAALPRRCPFQRAFATVSAPKTLPGKVLNWSFKFCITALALSFSMAS